MGGENLEGRAGTEIGEPGPETGAGIRDQHPNLYRDQDRDRKRDRTVARSEVESALETG